jgi:hypothetical protein
MTPRVENGHRRIFRRYIVQRWDGHGGSVYHYHPRHGRGSVVVQENPYRPSVTLLDERGQHVRTLYYNSDAVAHEVARSMSVTRDVEAA